MNISGKRINYEKKTVEEMILIYCKNMHSSKELCTECMELLHYAHSRLEGCRFGDSKPVCAKCKVHCYKPEMRDKIREVMRYAGPRMLIYHPILAIRHLADSISRMP